MGTRDDWDEDAENESGLTARREFVRGGRVVARAYRSPNDMLSALEQAGTFRIKRNMGVCGGQLRCTLSELETIERALRWLKRTDPRWGAFTSWRSMYSPPTSRLYLPGKAERRLPAGQHWTKREIIRAQEPELVAAGITKVAAIWHPPERLGPPTETEVGALFELTGKLLAWCTSGTLEVLRDKGRGRRAHAPEAALPLHLEDAAFLAELRKCAEASALPPARPPGAL